MLLCASFAQVSNHSPRCVSMMRRGFSVSARGRRCRRLSATREGEGRGVGPYARRVRSAGSGPTLGASVGGVRPYARRVRSAGSGPTLVGCARGGSAALVGSVGRASCVLSRYAPCARCGGLPPRLLVCLPLRAPLLARCPPSASLPLLARCPPSASAPPFVGHSPPPRPLTADR